MQEKIKGVLEKLKTRWKAIKRRTKVLMAVFLVLVLAAIGVVTAVNLNQTYVTLFTGLNQGEMGEIITYLSENGVSDYRISGSDTIQVPQSQENQLRAALLQQGYPTQGFAYDTYLGNVGALTTESERSTLFLFELQDRIAATVRCFDGVLDATVDIVQAQDNTYVLDSGNLVQATAAVTVTMEEGRTLTDGQVNAIQNLVSHSVQGLEIENVTINDTLGNNYTLADGFGDIEDASTLKLRLEQQLNNNIRTSVMQVLSPIYGTDNVRVSVNSTVNVDRSYTEDTDYSLEDWADDGSTGGRGIIGKEIYNNQIIRGGEDAAGGVVGTSQNADLNTYVEEQAQPNGTETGVVASGERDHLVDTTHTQVEHISGTVSDVMVAVTINSSVAGDTNTDELYTHIARASGIGTELQDEKISVLLAPFPQEGSEAPVPAPEETVPLWVLLAAGGGLLVFLLVLLVILLIGRARKKRRLRRLAQAAAAQEAAKPPETPGQEAAPPQEGADIMEMQTEKSMELRQDVRKFAEDNPELAAQLVKSWLREGDG